MSKNEFNELCNELLIDPSIALENNEVIAALRQHIKTHEPSDRDAIEKALINNF